MTKTEQFKSRIQSEEQAIARYSIEEDPLWFLPSGPLPCVYCHNDRETLDSQINQRLSAKAKEEQRAIRDYFDCLDGYDGPICTCVSDFWWID